MEEENFESELQNSFISVIPYMELFFEDEIAYTMSDTKKFLKVVNSKSVTMNAKAGEELRPGGAAFECIKAGKPVSIIVPKEVFGIECKAIGIPVKDEAGKIVGSIALGRSLERHYKMLNMSESISTALEVISNSVSDILKGVQNASENNDQIISYADEANKNTKNTDEILSFVNSISSQTNLLGLNAAIESARAGEYGRGFNVVAKEIRKLSSSSSKSISEINNVIKKVQESVDNISSSINKVGSTYKNQYEKLQEINASLEELYSDSQFLKELANHI